MCMLKFKHKKYKHASLKSKNDFLTVNRVTIICLAILKCLSILK
jgi:hypothetical protein